LGNTSHPKVIWTRNKELKIPADVQLADPNLVDQTTIDLLLGVGLEKINLGIFLSAFSPRIHYELNLLDFCKVCRETSIQETCFEKNNNKN
jgi:hypothetical protein